VVPDVDRETRVGVPLDNWTKVGLVLLLSGVALLAVTIPFMGSEVVARDSVSSDSDWLEINEVDLDEGSYTIWIEDVYPGFDDMDNFDAYASNERGAEAWGWYPDTYRTANFEGVDCEMIVGFDLGGGVWYFGIDYYNADRLQPPQEIEVFIVRSPPDWMGALVGMGITLASLGAMIVALLNWPKKDD
jgi:hypothetical protein